jgi:hypothetical protein
MITRLSNAQRQWLRNRRLWVTEMLARRADMVGGWVNDPRVKTKLAIEKRHEELALERELRDFQ